MAEIDDIGGDNTGDMGGADRRCRGRPQLRPDDETRQIIYEAARREFAGNGSRS